MRKASSLAALLAATLAVAGCSSTLDTEKAEKEIQQGIEKQTGVKVRSLACPDDIEAKKGDTFNCTAKAANGQTATVRVRQTDDEGNVVWRLQKGK